MRRRSLTASVGTGLVIALLCHGLYVPSNQPSAVAADATFGFELAPPSSVIAKQALDELWALRKKGQVIPAGVPGISVWSERYCEALRRENLPKDDYRAKLQAHVDFMEKYANAVIQEGLIDSPLAATDARYAFVRRLRSVERGQRRKASAGSYRARNIQIRPLAAGQTVIAANGLHNAGRISQS